MDTSPLEDHDQLTVGELTDEVDPFGNALDELSDSKVNERLELVQAIRDYEADNKDRVTALESIDEVLDDLQAEAEERNLIEDEGDESDATDSSSEESEPDDEEPVEEEEPDETDDEDEEPTVRQAQFHGADGSTRVLVRNADRTAKRVAGHGFDAGEVKDVKADDRVKKAIRRGELQTVKG